MRNWNFFLPQSRELSGRDLLGWPHRGIRHIAKITDSRGRKNRKILRKNNFCKKIIFFLGRKIMPILRFPHSLWVWGFWKRSNIAYFAIFHENPNGFCTGSAFLPLPLAELPGGGSGPKSSPCTKVQIFSEIRKTRRPKFLWCFFIS